MTEHTHPTPDVADGPLTLGCVYDEATHSLHGYAHVSALGLVATGVLIGAAAARWVGRRNDTPANP